MALGLLAGFGWSLLQPPTYSATASVALTPVPMYVTPPPTDWCRPRSASTPTPSCSSSPEVLRGDRRGARHRPGRRPSEHLSVTASPNSHVLHVTVTAAHRRGRRRGRRRRRRGVHRRPPRRARGARAGPAPPAAACVTDAGGAAGRGAGPAAGHPRRGRPVRRGPST